jgi:hypothetical protein
LQAHICRSLRRKYLPTTSLRAVSRAVRRNGMVIA